ncbi:MAG: class I SAM-dependent methyltransferase [Cyclobacteriaceae bacterium]
MYERLENCPSCQHPQFDNYLICEDHTVSHESFALVKCTKCELVFTNPRPRIDELDKYYQSEAYISHTDKANSVVHILYKFVRTYTLARKRNLVEGFKANGTILDYGCGTGDFLRSMQKDSWTTFGVEPNADAKAIAIKKNTGLITSDISDFSDDILFDMVTAWHVLEHVADLRETLRLIRKRIVKNGYLILAVPNLNSLDASTYGEKWAAYDVPRHLYHFTQTSLQNLADKTKFKLVATLPMKFDSYYVSMLSEKYRSGKNGFIKSMLTGFKSNISANKTGEYSSLIYVLKK